MQVFADLFDTKFWEGKKTSEKNPFLPGNELLKVKQIWRLIALWLR